MKHLKDIREYELENVIQIIKEYKYCNKILEIGAGAGWQSLKLVELGFEVEAIDIENSNYRSLQVFPVKLYDGINIPFNDSTFDIVYSSNVMEHVENIDDLFMDISRVLSIRGVAIHIMPSTSWRVFTLLTSLKSIRLHFSNFIKRGIIFPKHGEFGNSLTEIVTFNKKVWTQKFKKMNWEIEAVKGAGIFYTGYSVLGDKLSIRTRILLSKILGSSCYIYVIRPIR